MKIEAIGDMEVNGAPRVGIFIEATREEVKSVSSRHLIGDPVEVMGEIDYENWLSGQETPLAVQ